MTLGQLRALCPPRQLDLAQAARVAELQAARLLATHDLVYPPVPDEVITTFPRLQVERLPHIPVSGSSHWLNGSWVIVLNGGEAYVRRRFTLAHEFKHVLDAGFPELYGTGRRADEYAEIIADHFAACLLMPKRWVKSAVYNRGVSDVAQLARQFDVSRAAMRIRLNSLGVPARERFRCERAGVGA